MPVIFEVLGPLEVIRDGAPVMIGRARERQLLSALLIHAGEVVSTDRLVEALWGNDLPANPSAALQTAISRLRSALEDDGSMVVTRTPGYSLEVYPEQIDSERFERLIAEARDAGPRQAAELLHEALGLWRGPPYPEAAYAEFAQGEIRRLEQLRVTALEARIAAELQLGAGLDLVSELESLVTEFPFHERLWGHLMTALYRAGRQADALDAFQRARTALVEELGLDPSPTLRSLEESILLQEPSLDPSTDTFETPSTGAASLPRSNVPSPLTGLIGREDELQQVIDGLRRSRLVTIVGPAGVGKTRLAVEVAHAVAADYADGIDFSVFDRYETEGTPQQRFLRDLGLRASEENATDRIIELAQGNEMLQILDGCEPVMEEIGEPIRDVLAACPGLTILVTSRQRVGLLGETVIPLEPLDPRGPAVDLFTARARALRPGLEVTKANRPVVERIVGAADGLPLGIELAAGRVTALPLETIADELEDRIDVLATRDPTAAPEHRSLAAAIGVSWDRLPLPLQEALMAVASFRAPWDLDAAAAVCGISRAEALDACTELSERSLIAPADLPGGEAGFVLLNSVRTYALRRLEESGSRDRVMGLYYALHFELAAESRDRIIGPDQGSWMLYIQERFPDLEATFDYFCTSDAGAALAMASNLTGFFDRSQHNATGAGWLNCAIAAHPEDCVEKARAHIGLAILSWPGPSLGVSNVRFIDPMRGMRTLWPGRAEEARQAQSAVEVARLGLEYFEENHVRDRLPVARTVLANSLAIAGDHDGARELVGSVAIDEGLPPMVGCLGTVLSANLELAAGNYEQATRFARDALDAACPQDDTMAVIMVLDVLGRIARAQGDWAGALRHYKTAVDEYAKPHGLPGIAVLEAELALLYIRTGDLDASNRHSGRALRLARQNGLTQLEGAIRYGQFIPMTLTGQYDRALRYLDHGCRIFETLGHADGLVFGELGRGWTYEEQGDYPTATEHFRRSLELGRDDASALYLSFPLEGMAAVHHRKGDDATAAAVFGASDAIRSGARSRRPAYLPGARLIPVIKDRLGDEAWTRAHERGLTLSIDEAVDLALG